MASRDFEAYMERMRANERTGSAAAPLLPVVSVCKGCGTEVDRGVAYCAICVDKPQFQSPRAMIETGPQPVPAYERPDYAGNFRRLPVDEPHIPSPADEEHP